MTTPGPTDPKSTPSASPAPGLNPPLPAPTTTPPAAPPAPPTPAPTPTGTTPAVTTPPASPPAVPPKSPTPTPPAKPPANTPKSSSAAGAYVLAVFALIIAVAGAAAAAFAVKTAWDVRDGGTPAALDASTTPTPTGEPTATPDETTPAPSRTTPPPTTPRPTGPVYLPQFENVTVQVPAPAGCLPSYVDVDSATTGSDAGHEFYLTTCQDGQLQVRIDRTSGRAVSSGANPTAAECAALVRGSGTAELVLPAQEGSTFCLLTNRAQANANGLPQRLAIVTIDAIAATNRVTLVLSTFEITQP